MPQNSNYNRTGENNSPVLFNHDFIDNLIYPAGIISRKGIIEHANRSFIDIFGLEKDLGMFNWPAFFSTDCKKIVARAFINSLNGAFTSSTVELKLAENSDQNNTSVEILMQPLMNEGNVSSVLVFIKNSDKNNKTDNYSADNTSDDYGDSHYFEFSPLPLIRFNRNLTVYMCSRSFEGVVGYKCEEIAKSDMQVVKSLFKYDAEKIKNYITEIINGNIPFKRIGEIKIRTKNDEERVVNVIIYPVANNNEFTAIDL